MLHTAALVRWSERSEAKPSERTAGCRPMRMSGQYTVSARSRVSRSRAEPGSTWAPTSAIAYSTLQPSAVRSRCRAWSRSVEPSGSIVTNGTAVRSARSSATWGSSSPRAARSPAATASATTAGSCSSRTPARSRMAANTGSSSCSGARATSLRTGTLLLARLDGRVCVDHGAHILDRLRAQPRGRAGDGDPGVDHHVAVLVPRVVGNGLAQDEVAHDLESADDGDPPHQRTDVLRALARLEPLGLAVEHAEPAPRHGVGAVLQERDARGLPHGRVLEEVGLLGEEADVPTAVDDGEHDRASRVAVRCDALPQRRVEGGAGEDRSVDAREQVLHVVEHAQHARGAQAHAVDDEQRPRVLGKARPPL